MGIAFTVIGITFVLFVGSLFVEKMSGYDRPGASSTLLSFLAVLIAGFVTIFGIASFAKTAKIIGEGSVPDPESSTPETTPGETPTPETTQPEEPKSPETTDLTPPTETGAPSVEAMPTQENTNDNVSSVDMTNVLYTVLIIAAIVAIVSLVVFLFTKWGKARRRKKENKKRYAMRREQWEYVRRELSKVSASFTNAHVDPEYVLYKPLVISDAPQAQEFVNALMSARNAVESNYALFTKYAHENNCDGFSLSDTKKKVEDVQDKWYKLNQEAKKVGTPILDPAENRRIERLWDLSTNESATASERARAMDKIVAAVEKSRDKIRAEMGDTFDSSDKEFMLNAIIKQIEKGKKQGIITAGNDDLLAITA